MKKSNFNQATCTLTFKKSKPAKIFDEPQIAGW